MVTQKLQDNMNRYKEIFKNYKGMVSAIVLIVFAYIYISGAIGIICTDHTKQLSYVLEEAAGQLYIIQPRQEIKETIKIDGEITKISMQHVVGTENASQIDIKVVDQQGNNIVDNVTALENQTDVYLKNYNYHDNLFLIVTNLSDSIPIQYFASYEKSIGNGIGDLVIKKQIDYIMYDTYANVKVILAFAMVICFVLLFKFREDTQNKNGMARVLCVIIIFSTIIIRYSDFLLNGYGYFEYWGLYIDKANTYGWDSISIPDAGYLPLFNRLLTILLSYLPIGRGVQSLILNFFAVSFVVYVLTRFISKVYGHILPLVDRIILVLFLGCTLQNEQMITVINYTYFSAILVVLIFLQDFSSLSLQQRVKDIVLSITIVSKVALMGFLPPIIISFIYDVVKKNKARIPQDIAYIGVLCIQLVYLLSTGASNRTSVSLIQSIADTTYSFVYIIASFIFQNFDYTNISYRIDLFICALIIVAFAIYCLYILFKTEIDKFFAYFIICSAAYISTFMYVVSDVSSYFGFINEDTRFNLGGVPGGGFTKNAFIVITFIYFTILVGIYITDKKNKRKFARIIIYCTALVMLYPAFKTVYADSRKTISIDPEMVISANYNLYNKVDEVWAVPSNYFGSFSVKESYSNGQNDSYIGYFGNGEFLFRQSENEAVLLFAGTTHDVLLEGNSISTIDSSAIEAASSVNSDLVAIYGLKLFEGQNKDLYLACYDSNNNMLCKYKSIDAHNLLLTFIMDVSSLNNVTKICIEDEYGNVSSIKNVIWVCGQKL